MVLLVIQAAAMPQAAAQTLTPAEQRGKQIFLEGTSTGSNKVSAYVGAGAVLLPASAVPCAGCHGIDGLGRPEGGLNPPDIRWKQLTKSYGHVHENGRRHPAFDEPSLSRLVKRGIDPAGNRINQAMPLYVMSDSDMNDLVAYLKRLGSDFDPGVGKDRLQLATLLPLSGPQGGLGRAMGQVMSGYLDDLNAAGGLFGRRIELSIIPYGDSPQTAIEHLRSALEQQPYFALVGAYTVGVEQEVLDQLGRRDIPLVGPFTLDPRDQIVNDDVFYIYPGFKEQVRALTDRALANRTDTTTPVLMVAPEGADADDLVETAVDRAGRQNAGPPQVIRYREGEMDSDAVLEAIERQRIGTLLYFGEQAALNRLLAEAAARHRTPQVYLLSSRVSQELFDAPLAFNGRIYVAHPTLPIDITAAGRSEYGQLSARHSLPREHLQGQVAALTAIKLMVEGLKKVGREVYREQLVNSLEGLHGYVTGLTPPLSYGPNRRIGARGAHVVALDLVAKRYRTENSWQAVR